MHRNMAILTVLFFALLLPLSPVAATTPAAGDALTVGLAWEPNGLDPALYDFTDVRFPITSQILETLVNSTSGTATPALGLAQSWSISPDGLTWTFVIRSEILFHDGTSLDAAAVLFNLQRQWDPAHPYHNGTFPYFEVLFGGFKGDPDCVISNITASSATQVQITLQRPFSQLPSILASPWLAIASPTAVAGGGMDYHPVGTGPFRFVSWTAGDNVRLESNSSYWAGAPQISPLIFRFIPDASSRLAALQADTIQVNADTVADQLGAVFPDGRLRVNYRPAPNVGYLGINRAHSPLENILVRQAIAHALAKPDLLSSHFAPNAQLADQLVPQPVWGRDPGISDYIHDAALARSLLAQAGYPSGFSTTLAIRDVPKAFLPDPLGTANAIQADLAAAGIQVTVLAYDTSTFFSKLRNGELDLFLLGWTADYQHPRSFLDDMVCGSWQYFGPRDDLFCQKMTHAEAATTYVDQLADYQWGSRRVHDTLPLIPLAYVRTIRSERREITGIVPFALGWDYYATARYVDAWVYLPLTIR